MDRNHISFYRQGFTVYYWLALNLQRPPAPPPNLYYKTTFLHENIPKYSARKRKKADVNHHKENKNLSWYSIHKILLATSRNEMAKKSIVENEKQVSK